MNKYRQAVFILVYKKEKAKVKYLLLKRKLHWIGWEFPKGGMEKNETPMMTVIRELKEETNLSPNIIESYNVSGKYDYDKKTAKERKYKGQSWKLFSVQVSGKKVKLDKKEHSDCKWIDYKDALSLLTWENQRDCLKLVNKLKYN